MYVFERMAKQFTMPEETIALAFHFWLKKYEGNSTVHIRQEPYNPFATVNS
jgi:hypothetical protein